MDFGITTPEELPSFRIAERIAASVSAGRNVVIENGLSIVDVSRETLDIGAAHPYITAP
jgi:hypothetical protein